MKINFTKLVYINEELTEKPLKTCCWAMRHSCKN